MTNWDQLDAMGDLARLNQARDLAQQQAQRDASLAAQNTEIAKLLKEQMAREDAEKARLAAMPKCPDCRQPVAVGSRRCPHCRADIVSHKFMSKGYAAEITCRATDAAAVLQRRCDEITESASQQKSISLSATSVIDAAWRTRALAASQAFDAAIDRYGSEARSTILELIRRISGGGSALTAKDIKALDAERRLVDLGVPLDYEAQLESNARAEKPKSTMGVCAVMTVIVWATLIPFTRTLSAADQDVRWWCYAFGGVFTVGFLGVGGFTAIQRAVVASRVKSASEQLALSRQSREAWLAACDAKARDLDSAWRKRLDSTGLMPKMRCVERFAQESRDARGQADASVSCLQTALFALVETMEFADSIGVEVRSSVGLKASGVRRLVSEFKGLPSVVFFQNATASKDVDEVFTAFKNLERALRDLPLESSARSHNPG